MLRVRCSATGIMYLAEPKPFAEYFNRIKAIFCCQTLNPAMRVFER